MVNKVATIIVLFFLLSTSLAAQDITARLQRTEILQGESVILLLQSDEQGVHPELDVLEKDFNILARSNSSQFNIVNGRTQFTGQWQIELQAKRSGKLQIPPIRLGTGQTPLLNLSVRPSTSASASTIDQEIIVELSVDRDEVYVQAQAILTIRLSHRISILDGSLSEPDIPGAVIKRLGEDVRYEQTRGGRRYRVLERQYVVFPQTSGSLELPAVRFQGRIEDPGNRQRFAFGGLLSSGRGVRRESNALEIEVKPVPADAGPGVWLPAKSVELQQTWSVDGGSGIPSGEPVMRTVQLHVEGLPANLLPDLPLVASDDWRHYPDKAVDNNVLAPGGVIATRQQTIAYIPQQAGSILLPAVKIAWWDTEADQLRWAELPPRRVHVLVAENETRGRPIDTADALPNDASAVVTPDNQDDPPWKWIALTLFLLWLLTFLYLLSGKFRPAHSDDDSGSLKKKAVFNTAKLKKSCLANDSTGVREQLIYWANDLFGISVGSLGHLCRYIDSDDLVQQINRLNRHLYAQRQEEWQGIKLWKCFSAYHHARERHTDGKEDFLPALYS